MRGVIDESVPRKLATLPRDAGLDVDPFPADWKGSADGKLLDVAEGCGYAVLPTCDRSMPFQQTVATRRIALLMLPGQRLIVLQPLVPAIADAVLKTKPGTVLALDRTGRPTPPNSRD